MAHLQCDVISDAGETYNFDMYSGPISCDTRWFLEHVWETTSPVLQIRESPDQYVHNAALLDNPFCNLFCSFQRDVADGSEDIRVKLRVLLWQLGFFAPSGFPPSRDSIC